jgi:hypothetical protein
MIADYCLAGFMAPVYIGTTGYSFFLALPLIAVIAVAYKATKMEKIEFVSFVRESFVLFGSIVVFMIVAAIVIYAFMRLTIG